MGLYPHQTKALEITAGKDRWACYYDMGLGKSYIGSYGALRTGLPILVICQASKVDDWVDQFATAHGLNAYNLRKKKELAEYLTNPTIGVINYELFWRRPEIAKIGNDVCVMIDESSVLCNTGFSQKLSKQSKAITDFAKNAKSVILLSGTPDSGQHYRLWTQLLLINPQALAKHNVIRRKDFNYRFGNWCTVPFGYSGMQVINKRNPNDNEDELYEILSENCIFAKTEDVMDMPEKVFQIVHVPASMDYKKFATNDYLMDSDGKEWMGGNAGATFSACRQLASRGKESAVEDLLKSTNERVVIFYSYNSQLATLKAICDKLEKPISEVNGHCKDLSNYEDCDNAVVLVQYQSGSMGINLQKSHIMIFYDPPVSAGNWMQSQKRIHRIGQSHACNYYKIISDGTIDTHIYDSVERGEDYTEQMFAAQKKEELL